MSRKIKNFIESSSSESISSGEQSSKSDASSHSSSSGSSQKSIYKRKLSKKDLIKIIKLQKMIQREKEMLDRAKKRQNKKSQIKKRQYKQQEYLLQRKPQKRPHPSNMQQVGQTRKLFITGIEEKYSYEQVTNQFNRIMGDYDGLIGFRIKKKAGCPTYSFIDFEDKQTAKQGIQRLRKTKIFGLRLPVYYSQDQLKQNPKIKKCNQCNKIGHLQKDCYRKKYKDNKSKSLENKNRELNEPIFKQKLKQQQKQVSQTKGQKDSTQQNKQQKTFTTRVIRDKNRLNKLANFC